ncbi:MAG: hypothetical protein ACREBU_20935, partial [Nitrososphaera sp.]
PKDEESWYHKARCLSKMDKQQEALDAILVAVSIEPKLRNPEQMERDFGKLKTIDKFKRLQYR